MSNLNAVRTELRLNGERGDPPGSRRLGTVAVIVLLVLAVACGMGEIRLLPGFSADDFSSILFGAG